MDTPTPSVFPDYEIEEEIGCGNLTTVYRARRRSDGRTVSLKVVMSEFTSDRVFVRRFLEAGGRAIRLDHPNIARVYEVAERDGTLYIIREYIEASCLADWLAQKGKLSPTEAVPIIRQLASALDYAHSRRVMHGDINDRCIFPDAQGNVKLADFGLVQAVTGVDLLQSQPHALKMVQGVGAAEYLAPERVQGLGPNRPADIYALGIIAYQLLAGRPPFGGEPEAVLEAQVYQTPAPMHVDDPRVSPTLSAAIARALAKRPELRYNTATEFARAFAAAAEGIAPGRGAVSAGRPKPAAQPHKPPAVLAVVVLIAIAVAVVAAAWNLTGLGDLLAEQMASLLPSPVPPVPVASPSVEVPTPSQIAVPATNTRVPTQTMTPTRTLTPTLTPSTGPTETNTPAPAGSAAPVALAFSGLVVAAGIDANNQPIAPGATIAVSENPIYVFFNYSGMPAGTRWGHVWTRDGTELSRTDDAWPSTWGPSGRAWIFYSPEGKYLPGNYEVRLLVNDQVVASTKFVVQ